MNNKSRWAAGPYLLWMIVFVIVPLVLIGVFAFTTDVPYDQNGKALTAEEANFLILAKGDDAVSYRSRFSLENIFEVSRYLPVLFNSAWLALIATAICLVIGYPLAYFMSRFRASSQRLVQMLIMLPMWMNFLLRTYAWMTLLEKNGWINRALSLVGLGPFEMINTQGAVVLGMVYNYLPFMILPLYSVMTKIENHTIEAAQDLGAGSVRVFTKVVIPLSMPGIASGITMVFVPAVSTFIISRMLGGGANMLIGDLIDLQFLGNSYNPNLGAAISLVLMVFILLCMSITNQLDNGDEEMEGKML
ncbi:MAG: ABC transporter permease [Ruminococcaceae bacterium]|nr:ABC transporter permease [Oscillospiraceae bacterium]